MAFVTPLPLAKMSPRYLELNRLLDFFAAPGRLAGICNNNQISAPLFKASSFGKPVEIQRDIYWTFGPSSLELRVFRSLFPFSCRCGSL